MRKEFKNAKAKHGLNKKKLDKSNWSLILRDQKRKRREEKGRRRRRGTGREEEEKRSSRKIQRYGTMNSCMNFHTIAWLVAYPKPRV